MNEPETPVGAPPPSRQTQVTAQRIIVRDLSLSCRIGVTEDERARRQRIRLNLEVEVVPRPPTEDRIAEVVHYGHLVSRVRQACLKAEAQLLETLAEDVAAACFFDERIVATRVRIEKLDRYADVGGVGIEIERRSTARDSPPIIKEGSAGR